MGAGYVTLVTQTESAEKYLGQELGPEVLLTDFSNSDLFKKAKAFVVGPGSGKGAEVREFISRLIEQKIENVVLDADGLTILSEMKNVTLPSSWILTPHSGELSRLIQVSVDDMESDRQKYALMAAKKWGCHVLFKGFRSVLCDGNGLTGIIVAGNAALAKAGTGDVLSGFIGALLAQGMNSFSAAAAGAYLHGHIADSWVRSGKDINSLVAHDLIDLVPIELRRVQDSY